MAWVRTTEGVHVYGQDPTHRQGTMTRAQAERSAEERNERAKQLGIAARYEAAGE